ncbi:MAG: YiiX/YebB-like N1pC/P60 family cysteine hydrolase [Hyphomicrobiaceae bacterium]
MLSSIHPENLSSALSDMRNAAAKPADTAEALLDILKFIHNRTISIDVSGADQVALRETAPLAMQAIDEIYYELRRRLSEWKDKDIFTAANQHALREALRMMRYAKDILGEIWIDHDRIDENDPLYRAFSGRYHNTNTHPDFSNTDAIAFQSGDVILMRGSAHNSAAISMIGDIDSQFSHAALVYIDPDGKHWVIESLIHIGAHITPLENSLRAGAARALVFRHSDAALAAEAAKFMHDHVARSRDGRKPPILYDFSMRLDGGRNLFCSKLIRQAFIAASKGRLKLPAHCTVLGMKNRDFFKRIGVRTRHTFAPGDMELEPEFDLIAEWRDYRLTSRLRLQDVTMAKFFEWMDTRDYTFRETLVIRLVSWFGRLSGQLSETAKSLIEDVVPRVPRNMKRRTIAAVAMLHKTADPVVKALEELEDQHIRETGLPMPPQMIRHHLEEMRKETNGHIGYLRPQG